jgi:eukaryotic-like serine/threonine-protein kinase
VRKLDNFLFRNALYALAFIGSDSVAMAERQQWLVGKSDAETFGLSLASDTEAYAGHLNKARELTKRGVDSAVRVDSKKMARSGKRLRRSGKRLSVMRTKLGNWQPKL